MNDPRSAPGSRHTILYALSLALALIGLGLSLYATLHHLEVKASGATDAFCNINATFNCDDIARSSYAELFGIPLGVYGAGYFLALLTLFGVAWVRPETARENIQTAAIVTGLGLLVSLALAVISFGVLGKGCLICIGVYAVTMLQGLLFFTHRSAIPRGWTGKNLLNGGTYAVCALLVVVTVYNLLKPTNPAGDVALDEHGHPASEHQGDDAPLLSKDAFDFKIDKTEFAGLGQDYRAGSDDAKVVLIEFADYECPACRAASKAVKEIKQEYGDRILVVFKNFPLDKACNPQITNRMHEHACSAARLTRCVGREGRFWEMHDKIYENQEQLNRDNLRKWAKEYGLSDAQIDECLVSKDVLAKIQDDINVGNRAGVDATPTIFINGRKLVGGRTYPAIKAAIEKQLGS